MFARGICLAAAVAASASSAEAADDVYINGNFHLDALWESGLAGYAVGDPNFGTGRIDLRSGVNTGDVYSAEGYIEPELRIRLEEIVGGRFYGGVSGVGTATRGDGDAGGSTNGHDEDIDLEKLYLGWTNRPMGDDPVDHWVFDISGGRQDLHLGTGFLVYDGNFDTNHDATYWLAPRSAFSNSVVFKAENATADFTGFYLEGDKDQDRTELAGIDGDIKTDWATFGGMYAYVIDSADNLLAREGMDIVNVRAINVHSPSFPDLTFSGEYVAEFGSGAGNEYDASAFYVSATYTASSWRWKPKLMYRYQEFSGAGVSDTKIKNFDPFFFGASGGYGTWFLGEITGEYWLFNSNERAHMMQLTASPTDAIEIGAIVFHFDLDKKNYFGTPVTSRSFANEINVYANWTVNDYLTVGALGALAKPDSGGMQAFGGNKSTELFEAYASIAY